MKSDTDSDSIRTAFRELPDSGSERSDELKHQILHAGGLPMPPPAVTCQISSSPELVSFGDHHPAPLQRQNVGVQPSALAGVPNAPAPPVLVLLERIAPGPAAARLPTDPV